MQGRVGGSWITLDTVAGETGWFTLSTRSYVVDAPQAAHAYRLLITADNYAGSFPITLISLATWRLYGY